MPLIRPQACRRSASAPRTEMTRRFERCAMQCAAAPPCARRPAWRFPGSAQASAAAIPLPTFANRADPACPVERVGLCRSSSCDWTDASWSPATAACRRVCPATPCRRRHDAGVRWCTRQLPTNRHTPRPAPHRTRISRSDKAVSHRTATSAHAPLCASPPPCVRTAPTACRRGYAPATDPARSGSPPGPG